MSIRRCIAPVFLLAAAPFALGQITVSTTVEGTEAPNGRGVRAQAVITEASGLGAGVQAIAVKEIRSAIFVIDDVVSRDGPDGGPGLAVTKRELTASEAYGDGLPNGYNVPPTTDPTGPWQGLVWPYRDQYDYFPNVGDPLADNVGTAFTISPNVYGFVDVDGIARGGPTDPTPAGGDISRLLRGITGNGLNGPATYFAFDIIPLSGDRDRFVTVRLISTSVRVVVQDQNGEYGEVVVDVPDFTTVIQLPEPTTLALLPVATMFLARRRR
ncbi:MAG TPA: PEP-CTERM sorting domain-containing protein [Tepidisphaeraceae bacterium]|nr:PEP-CTERM sorting domain-containing protein [Tepidisphaeraceae bacterium]